jgi:hypothetical protein
MTSSELVAHGFERWFPFNPHVKDELLINTPRLPGVYVIRRNSLYERKRGSSDLTYVGAACNRQGLNMRLRQYFHPGPTQSTNKRILALISAAAEFEIAFVPVATPARAKALEAGILEQYEAEHGALPPENLRR